MGNVLLMVGNGATPEKGGGGGGIGKAVNDLSMEGDGCCPLPCTDVKASWDTMGGEGGDVKEVLLKVTGTSIEGWNEGDVRGGGNIEMIPGCKCFDGSGKESEVAGGGDIDTG